MRNNALGVQWVYLGTYPAADEGPGLDTLVESVDADLNTELTEQIAATVALTESYTEPFDVMLTGDNAPLEATVDALQTQGDLIAEAADQLGITVDLGV